MFVVLLRFSDNKSQAGQFMEAHNAWLQRGYEDGVFVLSGSLAPALGGAVMAHNTTLAALEARVNEDPFVAQNIVNAEIIEIAAAKSDDRLAFLLP